MDGHHWGSHATAYMTSTPDARCLENVSKLRQMSTLLLKQRRVFVIAADWHMELSQLETTGFLRWIGGCVLEVRCVYGKCRNIDYLVVSSNFKHCVRNVRVEQEAPRSAHVAFDAVRNPADVAVGHLP